MPSTEYAADTRAPGPTAVQREPFHDTEYPVPPATPSVLKGSFVEGVHVMPSRLVIIAIVLPLLAPTATHMAPFQAIPSISASRWAPAELTADHVIPSGELNIVWSSLLLPPTSHLLPLYATHHLRPTVRGSGIGVHVIPSVERAIVSPTATKSEPLEATALTGSVNAASPDTDAVQLIPSDE